MLFAFDAVDTSRLLYASEQNPSRDRAGLALRFNIPTVANGHVYVGAKHEVDVYGLLTQRDSSANEQAMETEPVIPYAPVLLLSRSIGQNGAVEFDNNCPVCHSLEFCQNHMVRP